MQSELQTPKQTFREYYREHPELFFESPLPAEFNFDSPAVENRMLNVENTKEFVLPLPVVGEYSMDDGYLLKCHRECCDEGTKFRDYWVSPNDLTGLYFAFEHSGSGLGEREAWQHRSHRGIVRLVLFEFYLKKFEFVQSGYTRSTQGELYWKRLVDHGVEHGHKATATVRGDKSEREITDGNLSGLWGNERDFVNLQIKIYAKH